MHALSEDTLRTRAAMWVAERIEKSHHLEDADPHLLERAFLTVESSVETGVLGIQALGIPVYVWILLGLGLALIIAVARFVRRRHTAACTAIVLVALSISLQPQGERSEVRFYPDDPLQIDPDTLAFDAPAPRELSEAYNLLRNTLGFLSTYEGPAVNTSTTGNVPSSSWFVDRHYANRRSPEELRAGPIPGAAPDTSSAWNVVDVERDGKSIGMQIVDGRGDRYIMKLDAPEYPEVSTGAEVVTSRFLHALGYYVPQNSIVKFTIDRLQPGRENVTPAKIERILNEAHLYPDSTYRAVASKYVEGRTLGPFKFFGTRPDDPNDIFPHELRRELRGLKVISAWLNHTDVRAENTLTSAMPAETGAFVRHYLIDFGTTLGGSPFGEQRPWAGHEYWFDPVERLKRFFTLGLYDSDWENIDAPELRGVGGFTADGFDPETWVPIQPNAAFRQMDAADAFWAAARIAWFSYDEIRSIVETGEYHDSTAVNYITEVLAERRNRIARRYLAFGGGLDRFRIEDNLLIFADLLATAGAIDSDATAERRPIRTVKWYQADRMVHEGRFATDSLAIPAPSIDRLIIATPGIGSTEVYVVDRRIVGVVRCDISAACDDLARRQALRERLFAGDP